MVYWLSHSRQVEPQQKVYNMDDIEVDKSRQVQDLINHIKLLDYDIKKYQKEKSESEAKLRDHFNHNYDGSITYEHGNHKITITTGINYKFNKKEYLNYLNHPAIDDKYKIVKEVISYELNKKAIRDCDAYGSDQDRYLKSIFITTSDKKLHITIKEIKDEKTINNGDIVVNGLSEEYC